MTGCVSLWLCDRAASGLNDSRFDMKAVNAEVESDLIDGDMDEVHIQHDDVHQIRPYPLLA